MSDYTRLTVQGTRNRADLVLPADEPIAAMLPDILDLVDEPAAPGRPLTLVSVLGEELNASLSLTEQDVRQGSIVRLVRLDEAPPPPEVADVTQLAGDSVAVRADRWRSEWAVLAGGVACLAIGWLLGLQAVGAWHDPWWVIAAAAALAAGAAGLARRGHSGAGWTTTALAVGLLGAPVLDLLARAAGVSLGIWAGAAAALVALVAQFGFADRAVALGGTCAVALVALWAGLTLAGVPFLAGTGVVAVAGTLGLGLLPGVAMTVSGLTGLDDRVIEGGQPIGRRDAAAAVAATHSGLNWSTVSFAGVIAAACFVLAVSQDPWAMALVVALGAVVLLRTRVLPLAPQRLALFGSATVGLSGLALSGLSLAPWWTGLGLTVAAGGVIAAVGVRLSDNLRARLGRLGSTVELAAVLASVPLLLGLLGLFRDLLGAF